MKLFKQYIKTNKEDIINKMKLEFNYSEKIKALRDLKIIKSDKEIEILVNHCFNNAIKLIKERNNIFYTEHFLMIDLLHDKDNKLLIKSFYYKTTENEHESIEEAIEEIYLTYIEDIFFDLNNIDRFNLLDLLIEKDRKIKELEYNIRVLQEPK